MRNGKTEPLMFTSLQFTPNRSSPPIADPVECWNRDPRICTGVLLFDLLIGNEDRGIWNLTLDRKKPYSLMIWDHECSVASDMYGDATKHLEGVDEFRIDTHCFPEVVTTDEYFDEWIHRIESIPKWFIDAICRESRSDGFKAAEIKAAAGYLYHRSHHFASLIKRHKDKFCISQWGVLT